MTQYSDESFFYRHTLSLVIVPIVILMFGALGYATWSAQLNNHVVHENVIDKVSDRFGTYCVFETSGHRYQSYNMCLFSVGEEGTFQQYNDGTWKAINP